MDNKAKQTRVNFEGALTVTHADDIQARLVKALDGAASVLIDVSAATDIDVSFLQILVAAQKSAVAARKTISILDPGASPLIAVADRCGLPRMPHGHKGHNLPPILEGTLS